MSRDPKNNPKALPSKARFNNVVFVNWSLSVEEKAACKAWINTWEDLDDGLSLLIQEGYKATFSWDAYRSCFTASLIPTSDAKSNAGYILSGKGSTPLKAVKQALFVHYKIMDGEWASYSTATNAEELDD